MYKAPYHKRPVGSMPKTTNDKNDTNIGVVLTRDNPYTVPVKHDIKAIRKSNVKSVFKIQTF